jgi:hypothetical protein
MRHWLGAIILAASVIGFVSPSAAKVIKFEIVRVESPAFEGRSFGAVGTYDRIVARATIAVPPDDPHNKVIVDLDRAAAIAKAAQQLVQDRLLLEDDAKLFAPKIN